jgi:hypothetical protein
MKPIEYNADMDRFYIPIGADYEIQTKGSGSTFRILYGRGRRFAVCETMLHEPLEAMARALHAADQSAEVARLRKREETIKALIATLYCAAGCSCCRDCETWEDSSSKLGALLEVPKYDDDSGHDWYALRDRMKGNTDVL